MTLFPCNECAKLMIQAGIVEVVYYEVRALACDRIRCLMDTSCVIEQQYWTACAVQDKNMTAGEAPPAGGILPGQAYVASKRMLTMAGVQFRQYKPRRPICI